MTTKAQLAHRAARGVISVQNRLLGLCARVCFRQQECEPRNILVLRSSAIGDFLCAVPALSRLRQRFPESRITLLTTPTGNPRYWKRMPEAGGRVLASPRLVDEIIFFYSHDLARPGTFRRLRRAVRHLQPDLTFLLPFSGEPFLNRLKKVLFLRLLGVRQNLRGYGMRTSLGVFREAQFLNGGFPHQVRAALEAVEGPGGLPEHEVVFWLDAPAEATRRVEGLWGRYGLNGSQPVVAVFPGGRFEHKRWPLENFLTLCRRLLAEFPLQLVVIGGAEDTALGATLAEAIPERVHSLAGQTTLLETAEVLRRCQLFIGNDSGAAHLAAAVGTPCVTIFSSVVFPGIWEPWGKYNTALRHSVPCEFCFSEGHCPTGTMECIRGITVEEVFTAARRYLQPHGQPECEGAQHRVGGR